MEYEDDGDNWSTGNKLKEQKKKKHYGNSSSAEIGDIMTSPAELSRLMVNRT